MTELAENATLRNILLDAAAAEFAQELSGTEPVTTSPHFRRRMSAMMSNPDGWAKRFRRPLWQKSLQFAAVILLVCSLSLGTLMAVSPTVRAAVVHWATEWYVDNVVYRYSGEQIVGQMPQYEITALPEGYAILENERLEDVSYVSIIYENTEGQWLYFDYTFMQQGSATQILTDGMTVSNITVNGFSGQSYVSQTPEQSSAVTWIDTDANLQFTVDGYFAEAELLHMAESVYAGSH